MMHDRLVLREVSELERRTLMLRHDGDVEEHLEAEHLEAIKENADEMVTIFQGAYHHGVFKVLRNRFAGSKNGGCGDRLEVYFRHRVKEWTGKEWVIVEPYVEVFPILCGEEENCGLCGEIDGNGMWTSDEGDASHMAANEDVENGFGVKVVMGVDEFG